MNDEVLMSHQLHMISMEQKEKQYPKDKIQI